MHLLVIDPQNDFCDPRGSLTVPGADLDMERLARLVRRLGAGLERVHVTLDSHHRLDIAHPLWWVDAAGVPPAPFTRITPDQVASGRWTTRDPLARERSLAYLRALDDGGRYPHVVWPEHCRIGSWGHGVFPPLFDALMAWERHGTPVHWVPKGDNPWTEHFSALRAEVPDPDDPSTGLHTGLLAALDDEALVLVAGEARSHCVASTVRDLVQHVEPARVVLVSDAMSDVPDPPGTTLFSDLGAALVADLRGLGARVATTAELVGS